MSKITLEEVSNKILDIYSNGRQLSREQIKQIEWVIFQAKLDLNSDEFSSAVSVAAYRGQIEVLEMLESHGLNLKNPDILSSASDSGAVECVKFLLEHGSDPRKIKTCSSYRNHPETQAILDARCAELELNGAVSEITHESF